MSIRARLFAAGYDRFTAGSEQAGLGARRQKLLASASGRVLDIGAGTGINLPHYGDGVTELTAVEPEAAMARRLERRIREDGRSVEVVRAPAEELPFDDDAFEVAVSTLVLCTVDDQHVRADEPGLARWQDRMNRLNRFVACGCNCNRRTLEAIHGAGFSVTEMEHGSLPKGPPFVRPLIVGTASPDGG